MSHVQTRVKVKQSAVKSNSKSTVNSKGKITVMSHEMGPETDCKLHADNNSEDSGVWAECVRCSVVESSVVQCSVAECSVEVCSGTGKSKLNVANRSEVNSVRAEVLPHAGISSRIGSKFVRVVDNLNVRKENRKLLMDSGSAYVGVADVSTGAVNKFCTGNVNPNVGQTTRRLPLVANRKQYFDQNAVWNESIVPVFVFDLNVIQDSILNVVKEVTQTILPDFAECMADMLGQQKTPYGTMVKLNRKLHESYWSLRETNRKLCNVNWKVREEIRAEAVAHVCVFVMFIQDQGTVSQFVLQSSDVMDCDDPLASVVPIDPISNLVSLMQDQGVCSDFNSCVGGDSAFIKCVMPNSIEISSDRSYVQFKRSCQAKQIQNVCNDLTVTSKVDALLGRGRCNSEDQISCSNPEVQRKLFRKVCSFCCIGQHGELNGAKIQEQYWRAKPVTYKRKPDLEILQSELQLRNVVIYAFSGECNDELYRKSLFVDFVKLLCMYPELQTSEKAVCVCGRSDNCSKSEFRIQNVPVKQYAENAGVTGPSSKPVCNMFCYVCKQDGQCRTMPQDE